MVYRYYCEEIQFDKVWDEDDFEYNFFQFFENEYIDLLDDIDVKPSGECSYDLDFIVTQAKANALKSYKDLYISITPDAEDSTVMGDAKISLHELICKHLDDEYCNNSYPYLDFAVYKANGKALQMYVEQGVWHYGLLCNDKVITDLEMFPRPKIRGNAYEWQYESCKCTPIIWFGPSDYSEILPDWSFTDDHPCLNVCDGSSCFLDWHRITDDESILIANDDNCEYRDIVLSDVIYSCPVGLRDTCCDASVVSRSIVSKYLDRFRNHPYESRYYCSDERMPFDFFANEEPVSYELDLNSLEEKLCEFMSYVNYPEYRYHPGKHFSVSWEQIENRMVEEKTNYIKQVYEGACFYSEQLVNGVIEKKERVLTDVLTSVTEKRTRPYDAGSGADIQQVIEYALKEFLELGQWHYSFRFADGSLCEIVDNSSIEFDDKKWFVDGCSVEPIFWFGQEYDPNDEYWILSRSLSRWRAICKCGELFSADMLDMDSDMMFYRWGEYGLDCPLVDDYIERAPISMDYQGYYNPIDIDEWFEEEYL